MNLPARGGVATRISDPYPRDSARPPVHPQVVNGRETIYRGIVMRSRTEGRFAAFLDRERFAWSYEPRAYADATGQYLPDFEIAAIPSPMSWRGAGGWGPAPLFVEVKGRIATHDEATPFMRRMEIISGSVPAAQLAIVCAAGSSHLLLRWANLPGAPVPGSWHAGAIGRCATCGIASFYPRVADEPWFDCRACRGDRVDVLADEIDPFEAAA